MWFACCPKDSAVIELLFSRALGYLLHMLRICLVFLSGPLQVAPSSCPCGGGCRVTVFVNVGWLLSSPHPHHHHHHHHLQTPFYQLPLATPAHGMHRIITSLGGSFECGVPAHPLTHHGRGHSTALTHHGRGHSTAHVFDKASLKEAVASVSLFCVFCNDRVGNTPHCASCTDVDGIVHRIDQLRRVRVDCQ